MVSPNVEAMTVRETLRVTRHVPQPHRVITLMHDMTLMHHSAILDIPVRNSKPDLNYSDYLLRSVRQNKAQILTAGSGNLVV